MRIYRWQGRNRNGKKVHGQLPAKNVKAVVHYVQEKYGYVTGVVPLNPTWVRIYQLWTKNLNLRDREQFFRQLGALLASGITLLKALDLLVARGKRKIVIICLNIRNDLECGVSFSNAIRKQGQYFPPFVAQLLEAGELSGNLPVVLLQLADYYRDEKALKNSLVNACLYPALVFFCAAFTCCYFLFRVLPMFLDVYTILELEKGLLLPASLFLGAGSDLNTSVLGVVLVFLLLLYLGRHRVLQCFLALPGISGCYHDLWEARYCRMLALLLQSGITLAKALDILGPVLPLAYLRKINSAMQKAVLRGMSFSKAATIHTGLLGLVSAELISLGEANGSLALMLGESAHILEEDLRQKYKKLKILLEPILLLLLTLVVGGIIYFIMTPIYSLVTSLPNYE